MNIIVVKNRVGEAVKVIERPKRLRELFMQTIAHFLGGGIRWKKYHNFMALGLMGPACGLAVSSQLEITQRVDIWNNKTGRVWQGFAKLRP